MPGLNSQGTWENAVVAIAASAAAAISVLASVVIEKSSGCQRPPSGVDLSEAEILAARNAVAQSV
jgi:hypothetical protein